MWSCGPESAEARYSLASSDLVGDMVSVKAPFRATLSRRCGRAETITTVACSYLIYIKNTFIFNDRCALALRMPLFLPIILGSFRSRLTCTMASRNEGVYLARLIHIRLSLSDLIIGNKAEILTLIFAQ
jgi:hypothetical protein